MKHLLNTLAFLTLLTACGKNTEILREIPVAVDLSESQDINNLIEDENDYRSNQGQTMLSNGLTCSLYTYTSGDRIQASIAGHNTLQGLTKVAGYTLAASFNQPNSSVIDGLNVLPLSLRNTYKTNYMLRCSGYIVVTDSDNYQFDLESDDASILYIDGSKLIDNDNAHGTTKLTASKALRRGVHAFRIDYAQQGGSQSLILKMNSEVINSSRFVY